MNAGLNKTAYITTMGVSVAAAMILSYIETLLPLSLGVPGVKMGLANIVIVFVLYKLGWRAAAATSAVRVALSALLFGTLLSGAYAAAGAALSLVCMTLLSRCRRFTPAGVSVTGAVAHNIGQIIVAILITGVKQIAAWLPVLIVSGVVTGLAIGAVGAILVKTVPLGKNDKGTDAHK